MREWSISGLAALVAFSTVGACAPAARQGGAASATAAAEAASAPAENRPAPVINHLTPARDSVGRAPSTFSWTPIEGADDYAIGVWNEVDQMVWRQNHIPGASVQRPEEIRLEPGTYFWSVSALQGEQELAQSGLAAFVVRTVP